MFSIRGNISHHTAAACSEDVYSLLVPSDKAHYPANTRKNIADYISTCREQGKPVQLKKRFGKDFANTWLTNMDLAGVDLRGLDLQGAFLQGSNLAGANLSRCNLYFTDLSDCNLTDATLEGADMEGANLKNANLSGANMNNANLFYATLTNTCLDIATMPEAGK